MFETFFIFVGFKIGVSDWFPCPNSPYLLLPHPYTSPFAVKAYPVWYPVVTCTIFSNFPSPFGPFTCVNIVLSSVSPVPNSPYWLYPALHTVPSALNIIV